MFSKIVVPLDRSSLAEQAIGQASAIARASGATIDVVLVHEPFPFAGFADLPWEGEESSAEHKYVEAIAAELKSGAGISATTAVLGGAPADAICRHVREVGADLVVMTSHGRTGFSRSWLGSVADAVMRNSSAPVFMLRAERGSNERAVNPDRVAKRILVPLDGSPLAAAVLPAAASLARATGASILLLRVVPIVPVLTSYEPTTAITVVPLIRDEAATNQLADIATRELESAAARLHDETGLAAEAHVVVDEQAATAIVDFARAHDADVIAMSTHGRGASRWLFGSVADKVLRASTVPILLRRALELENPSVTLDEAEVARQLPSLMPD